MRSRPLPYRAHAQYTGPEIDIWSMGVVLYVLVCGCLPFDAADMSELRARVLSGRFKVPFFMSPACERLIKRMLTVDPASRIKMADVKNDAWLNEGYSVKLGDPAQTSITVTSEQHEYVLGLMNRMGVPNDVVEQSLAGPDLPHVAATYHLVCDLKFPRKPMHDKVLSAESVRAAAPAPAVAAPAVDAPATAAAGLQPSGKRLPFEDDTVSDGEETAEDDDAAAKRFLLNKKRPKTTMPMTWTTRHSSTLRACKPWATRPGPCQRRSTGSSRARPPPRSSRSPVQRTSPHRHRRPRHRQRFRLRRNEAPASDGPRRSSSPSTPTASGTMASCRRASCRYEPGSQTDRAAPGPAPEMGPARAGSPHRAPLG